MSHLRTTHTTAKHILAHTHKQHHKALPRTDKTKKAQARTHADTATLHILANTHTLHETQTQMVLQCYDACGVCVCLLWAVCPDVLRAGRRVPSTQTGADPLVDPPSPAARRPETHLGAPKSHSCPRRPLHPPPAPRPPPPLHLQVRRRPDGRPTAAIPCSPTACGRE